MARLIIDGIELGAITTAPGWATAAGTLETTIVNSGFYSVKGTIVAPLSFHYTLNNSACYMKHWFYIDVTSNPSTTREMLIASVRHATNDIARVTLVITTAGAITLQVRNDIASTIPISGISVTESGWHCLEFKCTINASTGILEVKLDGATTTASSQNTGTGNIVSARFDFDFVSGSGGSIDYFIDDIGIDDAAHLGMSKIICRQGRPSSTPANNLWIKTDTGDASGDMEAVCSDTPLNTSSGATSTGANSPQTMVIHKFVEAQSGHGSETPFDDQLNSSQSSVDTLNAVQAIINAKRSGGGGRTHSIRIKINTTDSDETVTLTTSDLYYRSTFFSINTWDLSNGLQVGGLKAGSSGGQEMTISDIWVMAEYTPAVIDDPMVIIIE